MPCCFATYIRCGSPKRYGKVRIYPYRATGYARLLRWVRTLRGGRELANGSATPFRIVLLQDERLAPLLDYLAEPEHWIGEVEVLTAAEVTAFRAQLGHPPVEGADALTAECVARLSIERRGFGEWAAGIGGGVG